MGIAKGSVRWEVRDWHHVLAGGGHVTRTLAVDKGLDLEVGHVKEATHEAGTLAVLGGER